MSLCADRRTEVDAISWVSNRAIGCHHGLPLWACYMGLVQLCVKAVRSRDVGESGVELGCGA